MVRMKSNRRGTSIRLDEDNDAWLDEEAARTGKSRSDVLNKALTDARGWRPKVEQCYDDQKVMFSMFVDEVRNIHVERKKEHDAQTELLEKIKKLIQNHYDITNP